MGKWTALKSKYPKAPIDGFYQAKIEAIKDAFEKEGVTLTDLALKDRYVDLRRAKRRLEEGLAQVNAEITACEQLFLDRFESRGETKQTFEDGTTLYLRDEPSFKVGDPAAFYEWVKNVDHEQEYPLTVHPMTLAARLKDRVEAGDSLPPGVEIGFVKTSLGARGVPK